MENEVKQRKQSIFYPFGMVGAWSIVGSAVVALGLAQVFMLPQGSGPPIDDTFWKPVLPFSIFALAALGVTLICPRGSVVREWFLSTTIAVGAGAISFGLLLFATAERLDIEDFVQATPVAPENNYVCKRQEDGTMECLNALGEADPNFTSTIVRPAKSDP